jgi:hypothetical protein
MHPVPRLFTAALVLIRCWTTWIGPGYYSPFLTPSLQDCTSTSTPAYTVITCTRSGIKEGRPLPCGPLENCVSTSSVSTPTSFASPWLYDYETDK